MEIWVIRCILLTSNLKSFSEILKSKLLSSHIKSITVNRPTLFAQALELYKDADIMRYKLHVHFHGEEGFDDGGLTKEFFTLFWNECFDRYFTGNDLKVPRIIPDQTEESSKVMMTLGRVLTHQLILTGRLC